jgi:aryl-phospho-beta-D-glucosidase BglC (GH1 family)
MAMWGLIAASLALGSTAQARAAGLGPGINISHWMAQTMVGNYGPAHLDGWFQESDAELISRMGFGHVRLTLEGTILWKPDSGAPTQLESYGRERLKKALDMLLGQGLKVIVDIHPTSEFKKAIWETREGTQAFAAFWRLLARELKDRDPDQVLFEVLNEPECPDAERWRDVQAAAVIGIRQASKEHTIIVTGHEWGGIANLAALRPYQDRNLIYSFHNYDPFVFTHQGATWGWEATRHMKNLPYPSSPEAVAPLLSEIQDSAAKAAVEDYGRQQWDAARVAENLRPVLEWRERHARPIYCGEFGVYRTFSPAEDRARLLRDTAAAMTGEGIPWAMWDYAGGFAVAVGDPGSRTPDPITLNALGL